MSRCNSTAWLHLQILRDVVRVDWGVVHRATQHCASCTVQRLEPAGRVHASLLTTSYLGARVETSCCTTRALECAAGLHRIRPKIALELVVSAMKAHQRDDTIHENAIATIANVASSCTQAHARRNSPGLAVPTVAGVCVARLYRLGPWCQGTRSFGCVSGGARTPCCGSASDVIGTSLEETFCLCLRLARARKLGYLQWFVPGVWVCAQGIISDALDGCVGSCSLRFVSLNMCALFCS